MRPEDLILWLRATPFQPFRIVLNSGRKYTIRHPETVRVSRTTVHIYEFPGNPYGPYDYMEMVSLLLIERIEPVDVGAPA
jgi:hypothetical protein